MASQSLNGKVAIVTGSTQGLGLSIAKLFAQEQAA
ncbi:MAG: short-chain dehydrogenase, partial [SAR324 cluster bacterium]|nr:short-chain dehydrogenase [SAR324 cluster bacterium]